jgi:hypothetical protein
VLIKHLNTRSAEKKHTGLYVFCLCEWWPVRLADGHRLSEWLSLISSHLPEVSCISTRPLWFNSHWIRQTWWVRNIGQSCLNSAADNGELNNDLFTRTRVNGDWVRKSPCKLQGGESVHENRKLRSTIWRLSIGCTVVFRKFNIKEQYSLQRYFYYKKKQYLFLSNATCLYPYTSSYLYT